MDENPYKSPEALIERAPHPPVKPLTKRDRIILAICLAVDAVLFWLAFTGRGWLAVEW